MKLDIDKLFIGVFGAILILISFYPTKEVKATSGSTSVVFFRTSSSLPASPNVRICIMNQGVAPSAGMVKENGSTGDKLQTNICDSWLGVYLGKKATVNLTNTSWWGAQVDQDTKVNHDGSSTNYGVIPSGSFWGEGVR